MKTSVWSGVLEQGKKKEGQKTKIHETRGGRGEEEKKSHERLNGMISRCCRILPSYAQGWPKPRRKPSSGARVFHSGDSFSLVEASRTDCIARESATRRVETCDGGVRWQLGVFFCVSMSSIRCVPVFFIRGSVGHSRQSQQTSSSPFAYSERGLFPALFHYVIRCELLKISRLLCQVWGVLIS